MIFIPDTRHAQNSASCSQLNRIIGLSPALSALIGKYHYLHTFHCRLWLQSKDQWLVFIARFFKVMADITSGCRDFIPTVWLKYLQSWYSVIKILSGKFIELFVSIFPFTIYWQRNRKTTGIYFSFFIIFSIFTKILLHFSFIVCCDMPYSLASLLWLFRTKKWSLHSAHRLRFAWKMGALKKGYWICCFAFSAKRPYFVSSALMHIRRWIFTLKQKGAWQ